MNIDAPTVSEPTPSPVRRDDTPVWMVSLVLHDGQSRRGLHTPIGRELLLGRGTDLFGAGLLARPAISRRHARISLNQNQPTLEDCGSRNGTFCEGQRVEAPVALGDGALIRLSDVLFVVHRAPRLWQEPLGDTLVGASPQLAAVEAAIAHVAQRDTTVLVRGETGVGKELVARALHARSGRRGPFVAVNCGALTDDVLASELFGHVRGAFTGADSHRKGLVATAAGGTLFLDEVGDCSDALQVALLRLLQEREYRPVGSDRVERANVRIVAATHKSLVPPFREDLRHRLARWTIDVPPLRARPLDILPLSAHFAERYASGTCTITPALAATLLGYAWPGNVRELDAIIERLVVESPTGALDHPRWWEQYASSAAPDGRETGSSETTAPRLPHTRPDLDHLRDVVVEHHGNLKAAAQTLGIGRSTLYRWLREAGVDPQQLRA